MLKRSLGDSPAEGGENEEIVLFKSKLADFLIGQERSFKLFKIVFKSDLKTIRALDSLTTGGMLVSLRSLAARLKSSNKPLHINFGEAILTFCNEFESSRKTGSIATPVSGVQITTRETAYVKATGESNDDIAEIFRNSTEKLAKFRKGIE